MKQYKSKKIITETIQEELVYCGCDFCGKEEKDPQWSDITEFKITPNFGSRFDNVEHTFDICDDCLEKMTNSVHWKTKKNVFDEK